MGKQIVQVVEAICDRCGAVGDTSTSSQRKEWGELYIEYRGERGSRAYDGTAAGQNIKGSAWLCMNCTNAFMSFMENKA